MNTPLEDPVVTIGKESFTLKFSMQCQYLMSKSGMDASDLITRKGNTSLALVLDAFRAMTSHHFIAARRPIPTAEEWAARIEEAAAPQTVQEALAGISKAVDAAILKWWGLQREPGEAPKTQAQNVQ